MQLSHPFIMPFLGTCNNFDYTKFPSLVSPYFPNGNVNVYLYRNPDSRLSTGLKIVGLLFSLHNEF